MPSPQRLTPPAMIRAGAANRRATRDALVFLFALAALAWLPADSIAAGIGDAPGERANPAAVPADPAVLLIHLDKIVRPAPPELFGHNLEWAWRGQGFFDLVDGQVRVRQDLLELLAPLRCGRIRYPGGSLANTFRFRQALGPYAQRAPMANFFTIRGERRGKLTYNSEVCLPGFDDFMAFAQQASSGAIITINCTIWPENPEISGSAQEAAAWVAYANAAIDAPAVPLGKDARGEDWHDSRYWALLRQQHGREKPYDVRDWEIGNEVCDPNQGANMNGPTYAARATEFAKLMKKVDPTIRVGLVLGPEVPAWNGAVLDAAAGENRGFFDFLIWHEYGPGELGSVLPFWSAGRQHIDLPIPAAGVWEIAVTASGQPAQGQPPLMSLQLDDKELAQVPVAALYHQGKKETFRYSADLTAGQHRLSVDFRNDVYAPPEDRNLFVHAVTVTGPDGKPQAVPLLTAQTLMAQMAGMAHLQYDHLQIIRVMQEQRKIALPFYLTEHGSLYGLTPELLQQSDDLKSALYAAAHLQGMLHEPDVTAANYWCLNSAFFRIVEEGEQGRLRYSPAGLVFRSMVPLMQGKVVTAAWENQQQIALPPPLNDITWLDATAVRQEKSVAIQIIHWHPDQTARVQLQIVGASAASGEMTIVTGPSPTAKNAKGMKPAVKLSQSTVDLRAPLLLPPVSVSTLVIALP